MSNLRSTLTGLAQSFAVSVLDAIRQMSLEDLVSETGNARGPQGAARLRAAISEVARDGGAARGASGVGRPAASKKNGRLSRRSADDIAAVVDSIVGVLSKNPSGLRAEQIRAELGLDAKELPRPLAEALAARKISKRGQKRATTYFAAGRGAKAPAATGTNGKAAANAGAKTGKRRGRRG